ncbi:MAG: hypothetical protein R6U95_01990 [Bacteroidales bacterium]
MINRIFSFFLLFGLALSCRSEDIDEMNIFLTDFSWHIQIGQNSLNFNSIAIVDSCLYVLNIQSDSVCKFSITGDTLAKRGKTDFFFKEDRFIWDYIDPQTFILDSIKGETSTYYPITLKDSSVIQELKLESYRQKTRGVNNEYALCFKDSTGVEYKLMFPTDENKGAIAVYDVVSYDSTKLVISFWYYERWGVSNTQLGVLDLAQCIKK